MLSEIEREQVNPNLAVALRHPLHLEEDVEFYEATPGQGPELCSAADLAFTQESVIVVKGQLSVEFASECDLLRTGNSATYRADVPHSLTNAGRSETLLFLVVIYP